MHEFDFGPLRFGEPDKDRPDEGLRSEQRVKLGQAMSDRQYHFEHRYAFGDGWRHCVVVEDLFVPDEPLKHAQYTGGQNACPPEDVGGTGGYAEFLAAIFDPTHKEDDNYLGWHGGPFNPNAFDIDDVNERLAQINV